MRCTENSVKDGSEPTKEASKDAIAVTTGDGSLDWK